MKRNSISTVDDSNWHHIVATFNGTDASSIHIYIDGTLDDGVTSDGTLTGIVTSGRTMRLGNYAGSNNHYTGILDEVGVWSRSID